MECKPPLGITPRFVIEERRIAEIQNGINRFIDAKHPIPIEWIEELNEYFNQQVKFEQQAKSDNVYKSPDVAGDHIFIDSDGNLLPF